MGQGSSGQGMLPEGKAAQVPDLGGSNLLDSTAVPSGTDSSCTQQLGEKPAAPRAAVTPGSLHALPDILQPVNHGEVTRLGWLSKLPCLMVSPSKSEADSQCGLKRLLIESYLPTSQ